MADTTTDAGGKDTVVNKTVTDNTAVRYAAVLIGIPAAILAGLQMMSSEVNTTLMLSIIVVSLIGIALAFVKVDYILKIANLVPFFKETTTTTASAPSMNSGTYDVM